MIRVGLTGNIGSGKTLVAKIFEILGVPVFNADLAGRSCLSAPAVVHALIQRFGKGVVAPDGTIDRKSVASIVFSDPEAMQWLNALIHPKVWQTYDDWHHHQNSYYTIHEAAILFEHGFHKLFDQMILVLAPYELRLTRVMQRDLIPEREFQKKSEMQWPEEKLIPLAHHLIYNDGKQALLPQVLRIHQHLLDQG